MPRSKAKRACPCGSAATYAACCQPAHRGTSPETPDRLVRARFAAFALGDGAFLRATIAPSHPLSARPAADVIEELSRAHKSLKYRSVEIREVSVEGETAQVLFEARVFEKGRDVSFVELSDFIVEGGRWVYVDGLLSPRGTQAAEATSIATYLAAYRS